MKQGVNYIEHHKEVNINAKYSRFADRIKRN